MEYLTWSARSLRRVFHRCCDASMVKALWIPIISMRTPQQNGCSGPNSQPPKSHALQGGYIRVVWPLSNTTVSRNSAG